MEYKLIRSRRKTLGLEIKLGEIIVRAPLRCPKREIDRFVISRADWIEPRLAASRAEAEKAAASPIGEAEQEKLKKAAREYLPARAEFYAQKLGVSFGSITVRCQKTRWGSCSKKGAPEVIDSVVVHELCHLKHFDHSPAFYADVLAVLPDYRRSEAWLKTEGRALIARAHN